MSKYTTEVRFICEQYSFEESVGYDDIDNVVALARKHIFDFKYPIFDEDYREALETKILVHYYTREICEETVGLWKLRLRDRMNMIMPYANKLYESSLLEFNPFHDVDLNRKLDIANNADNTKQRDETVATDETVDRDGTTKNTGTVTNAGTNSRTGTSSTDTTTDVDTSSATTDGGSTWDLYSDTPQGGIRGIQGAEDDPALGTNAYLTNARHIINDNTTNTTNDSSSSANSETNSSSTGTDNNTRTDNTTKTDDYTTVRDRDDAISETTVDTIRSTEDYLERVTGKTAGTSYSRLLMEFRETFLNIDKIVIDSLDDLFFGLWE